MNKMLPKDKTGEKNYRAVRVAFIDSAFDGYKNTEMVNKEQRRKHKFLNKSPAEYDKLKFEQDKSVYYKQ